MHYWDSQSNREVSGEESLPAHNPLHNPTTPFPIDIKWNADASEKHIEMQIDTALCWNHSPAYSILAYSPKFNCKQSDYGTKVIKYTKRAGTIHIQIEFQWQINFRVWNNTLINSQLW